MSAAPGRRWILAATIAVVGMLQAWDSKILEASALAWLLVAAGIVVPAAAALVSEGLAAILVSVPVCFLLLFSAGLVSEPPLHGLLVIPVAAGAILGINLYIERREREEAQDEGG